MSETSLGKHLSIDMNHILESRGSLKTIATSNSTVGADAKEELPLAEKFLLSDKSIGSYLEV